MIGSFKYRASISERMDAPDAPENEVDKTLKYIDFVNRTLGGYPVLIRGLKTLMRRFPEGSSLRVLDVGCGAGHQIRYLREWFNRRQISAVLAGVDLNPVAIQKAKSLPGNENIAIHCNDALSGDCDYEVYDIVICSLFLHHLSDQQIVKLFKMWNKSGVSVLINDLHRSFAAWLLFRIFAWVTNAPRMAKFDGAASVRNAFTKKELLALGKASGYNCVSVRWRWAFRYEMILSNE